MARAMTPIDRANAAWDEWVALHRVCRTLVAEGAPAEAVRAARGEAHDAKMLYWAAVADLETTLPPLDPTSDLEL